MTSEPAFDPVDFIRTQTLKSSPSLVPEVTMHLATEITPLWQLTEDKMQSGHLPPPFWAFAWPGGQGVARYILDNPDIVRGKHVIDFATGGGIVAIAAKRAGAKHVTAIDIDPFALHAVEMNAALNGVTVEPVNGIDMTKAPEGVDLILTGDVCYQQAMATRIMRWLWLCVASGIRVIMADPGRAYVPQDGLTELATYTVPTTREIESEDSRTVKVWDVGVPGKEG